MGREDFRDPRREFSRPFERRTRPRPSISTIVRAGAAIVFAALLVAGSVTSFYTVDADEVAVVLRFGKYLETTEPGLHFKIPFGVDTITSVKVNRIHKEEFGFRTVSAGQRTRYSQQEFDDESLMLTADLSIADVEWIVQYKISDPYKYLFRVKNLTADGNSSTLRDVTESAMRLAVGDHSIDEVIALKRPEIAAEVRRRIQENLDLYDAGLEVVTVELQDINPPLQVRDSFNEVNRAIQEKQTSINEARRDWNKEIPAATGEAMQMIEAAEGYKTRRVNESRGDVARFSLLLTEYEKAKDVTRARLYLETLEDVLPLISQVYVVDDEQSGPLQVLDLKAAAARRAGASTPPRTPQPTPRASTTRRPNPVRPAARTQGGR